MLSAKVVDQGFFSEKYELYGITNSSTNSVVHRTQADFNDLSEALTRTYPGYIVPPLPKSPIKKYKSENLDKNKTELQFFLSYLLQHPLLKRANLLWNFLTIEDEKEFKDFKERTISQVIPEEVSEFTTLEGEANIYFDRSKENFCHEIAVAIKQIQEEFGK
eukprot:TRINITY_DN10128_c0_g1_i3.p3 TRINITY_DN10128_c0_g1~~TRINITY_DN10128_c0_g1_i3.p3  ORF type:complete len:162 (+),score=49.14 TRINITY_DN10128_c0_g1_i3:602-1087(+)